MAHTTWYFTLPLLGLAGCNFAPDYARPETPLPATLPVPAAAAPVAGAPTLPVAPTWWQALGDPQLDAWVQRALAANDNAAIAAARLDEARALFGQARANQRPNLTGSGSAARQDASDYLSNVPKEANAFNLSATLSYELDLWGRLRNSREAARQQLLSSTYGYESVRQTLIADTVTAYFNVVVAREQVAIGEATLADRQESLRLQQLRYDAGAITELDRQQAEADLAAARTRLPGLRRSQEQAENALLTLAGANPEDFWSRAGLDGIAQTLPEHVRLDAEVLPLALLRQRPDIRAAEAEAEAATANIGVAKAQRWPTLSVGALLGSGATDTDLLFDRESRIWSLTGSLAGPLYDFGRSANRVDAAEAQQEQALLRYQQVVKQAFREVRENAQTLTYAQDQAIAAAAQAAAYDRTVELARTRYDEGYTSFLELLDARRAQFEAQLTLSSARLSALQAAINLNKALGAGLRPPSELLAEAPAPTADSGRELPRYHP